MRFLSRSSWTAMTVVVTFITMITFSPTLISCGGGDDGGGGGGGGETANTFAAFQSATTDSTGKATFTPTKLKDASGNAIAGLDVTLTLSNGQPAANLTVYFGESDDSHYMVVGRDAGGAYQTIFMTGNSQEIAPSSSASVQAFNIESGEPAAAGAELVDLGKDFGITITGLVVVAFVSLVATVSAFSLQDKINKVAGKIDPVRLATTGRDCFSFSTLMDHLDIATEAVDLLFWTASTLATAGAAVTMDAVYEVILGKITDEIKDRVEDVFWDEVVSGAFTAFSITKETNLCWILRTPSLGYAAILEVRPDKTCTTAADCDAVTPVAQDFTKIDGDQDGYTPAANDCNDSDAMMYPGAFEVCDSGIDSNCDGATTACNVTTNLFMDPWPEGGGNLPPDGNGDIATLVELQGSFLDMGSETDPDVRLILNRDPAQKLVLQTGEGYGPGDFGFYTFVQFRKGVNRIQVAANAGSYHGSETYYFNNTNDNDMLSLMLTWDDCPDLDLYVVEPDSGLIYWANTLGTYGQMAYPRPEDSHTVGWGPEIYRALNPVAGQTYFYYVKHAGNGSCGEAGHSTFYTVRVFTPYGNTVNTSRIAEDETGRTYEVSF